MPVPAALTYFDTAAVAMIVVGTILRLIFGA
jgi:hypothetical protein